MLRCSLILLSSRKLNLFFIHHAQVFSDPALVQEVKLVLPQVGDPDSVTVQVATGQEVDEGVVEVGRDEDRDSIRLNIRIILQPSKCWVGVGKGFKEFQIFLKMCLCSEGHQVDINFKWSTCLVDTS